MSRPFLPYGTQSIDEEDIAAVVAVLRSGALTTGAEIPAFEKELATTIGAADAVAVSSGTAALHLAAWAADLQPGEAVVVPALTFLATATAPHLVGAEIIFSDVDPDTGLMTASTLHDAMARAGERRVRAVFPVHYAGQSCDMASIAELARSKGALVIEDACHALGAAHGGLPVGACAHSDMCVFSFHPVKTVTTGEGGAIAVADPVLAERLRRLRSHGMVRDPGAFVRHSEAFDSQGRANPWYYEMEKPGLNYRITDIQCALGRSQLRRLRAFVARRNHLVALYRERLAPLAPHIRPLSQCAGGEPAWHLAVALIDFAGIGIERSELMFRLRDAGVGSQVHYLPVNRQPYWQRRHKPEQLPGADAFYARCLSLPLFFDMQDDDVHRVVDALTRALAT